MGEAVLEARLLASNCSLLVVHDWEREEYQQLVWRGGWRVWQLDTASRRHTAALLPPPHYLR